MDKTVPITQSSYRAALISGLAIALVLCLPSRALAFQLQAMDESRVNLMDYVSDDKWTVVMFWSTDCFVCEEQKPALETFHLENRSTLAEVVGVATDGMEKRGEIERLNQLHNPSYPNLVAFSDVFLRQFEELVGKPYRASPTFVIFDPQGNVFGRLFGYVDFEALASSMMGTVEW